MSYILDALKKSDQQRQRGVTPTLLTAQVTTPAPKRPKLVLDSILVAVLLCAGIAVGWLRPWQSVQPVPALEPIAAKPATPGSRLIAQAPSSVLPEMAAKREQVELTQSAAPGARSVLPSAGTTKKQETPPIASGESASALTQGATVVPKEEATSLPQRQDAIAPTDAEPGRKVLALSELPASIQQEIPGISISFLAYSSRPKDRRVMINGAMAGQGEILAP
ncbi:MAG: hypothetical protein WCA45_07325, partial [Thiobacillaceae bacterium]